MKTATELSAITHQNALTIKEIENQLEEAAKNGLDHFVVFKYVPSVVLKELMKQGYYLTNKTGPMGELVTVITW